MFSGGGYSNGQACFMDSYRAIIVGSTSNSAGNYIPKLLGNGIFTPIVRGGTITGATAITTWSDDREQSASVGRKELGHPTSHETCLQTATQMRGIATRREHVSGQYEAHCRKERLETPGLLRGTQ